MKKIVIAILFVLVVVLAFAQDDFASWKASQSQKMQSYKDANDAAFKGFLEENWKAYKTFSGIVPDKKPKPKELPVAEEPEKEEPKKDEPVVDVAPVVPEKEEPKEEPKIEPKDKVNFDFYGKECSINYKAEIDLPNSIDNQAIANFFAGLSQSDYQKAIEQLQLYKEQMRLNDYAYVMFLQKASASVFADSRKATLFAWFALLKSGYAAKVGYSSDNAYLLIPSEQIIYMTSYLKIDGKNYFLINKKKTNEDVYSYAGSYPDADKSINMIFKEDVNITDKTEKRDLSFVYMAKKYEVHSIYDKSSVLLYADYPQTKMDVYYETPLSASAKENLLNSLAKIIDGKTEAEAVNLLLAFVQKSFAYKTDDDQFGREKTFFPEELFYYPYSDCEDRSILFAYLVRNLLHLDVLGLEFPGHMATAVKFSNPPENASNLVYEGNTYTICDPTYVNAQLGMCMPQFKNVNPKIVVKKL